MTAAAAARLILGEAPLPPVLCLHPHFTSTIHPAGTHFLSFSNSLYFFFYLAHHFYFYYFFSLVYSFTVFFLYLFLIHTDIHIYIYSYMETFIHLYVHTKVCEQLYPITYSSKCIGLNPLPLRMLNAPVLCFYLFHLITEIIYKKSTQKPYILTELYTPKKKNFDQIK